MHHSPRGAVRVDPNARALADHMLAMDDVMATILDETIPSESGAEVTESGRTLCGRGTDIHGPLARFPTAVELASCPVGTRGGTWHTHVTQDQLRNPTNSLPDTANVIFDEVDVSVVVGTQSADAVVAAADREATRAAFRDALGADVRSTDEVVDAIISGRVSDPPAARRRVRSRLSPLFDQHRTNFSGLDRRIGSSGIPAHSVTSFEVVDARHHAVVTQSMRAGTRYSDHSKNPKNPQGMRRLCRIRNQEVKQAARAVDAPQIAVSTTISEVVGRAVRSFLP